LRREEELEDISDGGGHDSEEEEEGHYEDEVGVTDLLQDPHPHTDTGLATSFTLL
jgi:hypothetical protein